MDLQLEGKRAPVAHKKAQGLGWAEDLAKFTQQASQPTAANLG